MESDEIDRFFDAVNRAEPEHADFAYEEREVLAEVLMDGSLESQSVSPRLRTHAEQIFTALQAIPEPERRYWASVGAEMLTEPRGKPPLPQMSDDDRERELERRERFRLRSPKAD